MLPLTTAATSFTRQLSVGGPVCNNSFTNGCGCSSCASNCSNTRQSGNCGCDPCHPCNICCCLNDCCNIKVNAATTFDVTNAYVITHSFDLTSPTLPADLAVTVDGNPITGVEEAGGQYIGDISGIMSEITKCPCGSPCSDICPGNFVMVTASGPWSLTATIVLEGTVYDGGSACQFRLCFSTAEGTPISVTGTSGFALCGVEIPCQVNGVSPSLQMDFDACASILNPTLTAAANGIITLTGSLVVTPQLRLRVTRPSLFNLDAKEINLPCDDVGQCSDCNSAERGCLGNTDNCCCGQSTPNRVAEIMNMTEKDGCNNPGYNCNSGCGCEPCGNPHGDSCCEPCGDIYGSFNSACNCDPCCDRNASCGCEPCGDCNSSSRRSASAEITCQCCDTNGYSF